MAILGKQRRIVVELKTN